MQPRLTISGCTGSYTLQHSEQVSTALLNDLICAAQSAGLLLIDLLIPLTRVNAERGVLEVNGQWQYSGSVQTNENNQVVVYAQYRHATHRTGSDGNLAVDTPRLAPTEFERAAQSLMVERYGRKE